MERNMIEHTKLAECKKFSDLLMARIREYWSPFSKYEVTDRLLFNWDFERKTDYCIHYATSDMLIAYVIEFFSQEFHKDERELMENEETRMFILNTLKLSVETEGASLTRI